MRARTVAALRWGLVAALLGTATGASAWARTALLPAEEAAALGVRIAGVLVPAGVSPRAAAEEAARRVLDRRFTLTWGGEGVLEVSLAELGATVDVAELAARVAAVGRDGALVRRVDEALEARRGHVNLALHVELPAEPLASRLARVKEERDSPPVAARLDLATHAATEHTAGRYLDVYAALAALDRAQGELDRARGATEAQQAQEAQGSAVGRASRDGRRTLALPTFELAPRASREAVGRIDASQVVSRYETHFGFLGGQAGRAQNIERAARGMDGVVLMPGDVVSFNASVGPRSTDNGFTLAPEIYKGELRLGVGGGTCQVAGTLHAAAYLGGLEVVERASHSRPSGYIPMGLDATVVYPTVDLKLRNPYAFPVVVHRTIDHGTLAFELLGQRRPATVSWATETVGTADFKRKVEELAGLPEGKFVLKQHGIRGYSIKKTRVIRLFDGGERTEVTTDTYPPTFEIYQVPPGTGEDELPELPDSGVTAANEAAVAPAH